MVDYSIYDIGTCVKIEYNVPDDAPGFPGPSGIAIIKIANITNAILWGWQISESNYHPNNVRFYKKYITHIESYKEK